MTDREAIRRLAALLGSLAAECESYDVDKKVCALENELLTDPPAPTVTREQADRFVAFLRFNADIGTSNCPARQLSGVSEVPMEDRCWACQIGVDEVIEAEDGLDNWPAFFRAVADALEREA